MVHPTRRRVLAASAAATAFLAGCSGDEGSATSPTSTPAETATDTATPSTDAATSTTEVGDSEQGTVAPEAEFDCAAAERPEPEATGEDLIDPADYPGEPEGQPDAEWATGYEEAFVRNYYLAEGFEVTEWNEFTRRDDRVESHPRGTVVWISYRFTYTTADGETTTAQTQTAAYYVDDRGVRRFGAVGELPEKVNAHAAVDGKTVECY